MKVTTKKGNVYHKAVSIPRGLPGNPLTKGEHVERFRDCLNYAAKPLPKVNTEKIISMVDRLEESKDVRSLIPLLSVREKRR